ncbi:MAG: putative LPS assembly protein LptD [Bacteroidota bacterium]
MTRSPHNKVFFFCLLLISICSLGLHGQTKTNDTLSVDEGAETIEEQITYSAEDSIVSLPKEGKAILYGKSKVNYGSMIIESEIMEIDYLKNVVTAYGKKDSLGKLFGNPSFKDGSEPLEAEKIMYNLKTKKGKIFSALTKQGELLVFGNEIKKDSNNVIYFKDMKCLPCQDKDARTAFIATKAKVIPNDKIVTGPMYLSIAGVPTPLGLPFGFFPNTKKQHNGILLPQYGYSAVQGFFLKEGGYYWGVNDRTNMIIKGDFYSNGSWALNTTNNYNVLYKANGSTYFGYKQFNNGDKDIPKQFSVLKAFELRWTHNQDNKNNPSVRFSSNVNFVKNQNVNRLNTVNTTAFLQNTFMSRINYTKTFKRSSLSIDASHSQNVQTHIMEIVLPGLTFNVNRFYPFKREGAVKQNVFDKIGISYFVEAKNKLSGNDSTLFKGRVLDSLTYGIKQSIPISTNFNLFKYITATPQLNINSYTYTKWTKKEWEPIQYYNGDINTPKYGVKSHTKNDFVTGYDANFSTSFSSKVYFDYIFKKGKVKQIRHLLIPTLSYNYHPDFGSSQFGFWRKVQSDSLGNKSNYSIYEKGIYGGPGTGKLNGLAINLNSVVDAKYKVKTDTGTTTKKATIIQGLGLGTNYNFAADSFRMSNIGLTVRTVIFKIFNVNFNSSFDPYVYDHNRKRRVDKFTIDKQSIPGRFVNGNLALSTSIGNETFRERKAAAKAKNGLNKVKAVKDEEIQWGLSFNYNLTLTNSDNTKIQPSHALSASGNIAPTKFWKIRVSSGFDFTHLKISYTSFEIFRDLKCWQANISWVPFGVNKSYKISLNLKTAMLSEFKIPKQKAWYDNF